MFGLCFLACPADSADELARELSRLRDAHAKFQDRAALDAARAHDREMELHATIQALEARLAKAEVVDCRFFGSSVLKNHQENKPTKHKHKLALLEPGASRGTGR